VDPIWTFTAKWFSICPSCRSCCSEGGLLRKYRQSYNDFYKSFFQNKENIFENYLVNNVIARLFPFTRGSYLDLYRELVLNLSVIQVLLVGIAAHHKGLDEMLVIQLFQSLRAGPITMEVIWTS